MGNWLSGKLKSFVTLFRRQLHKTEKYKSLPAYEAHLTMSADKVYETRSMSIDNRESEIRKWITRGLAGGLVSSLTLLGSKALLANDSLSIDIRVLTVTFILGLGAQFTRQILLIQAERINRAYAVDAEHGGTHYEAPGIFAKLAFGLDFLAMTLLFFGVAIGIKVIVVL